MWLRLALFLLFSLHSTLVFGEEIGGKALLKKGKCDLENQKYTDTIINLSMAEKEFPLLGDYALFWLSEAYYEAGNYEDSLKTIRNLLIKYPDSPLKKKARIREIAGAEKTSQDNIQEIFESYIKEYPSDSEMKYLYARWLKEKGQSNKAKLIFKDIFVSADPFSEMARNELTSSDLTTEDLINRASNLMNSMDFKGAESLFRSLLSNVNENLKNEVLEGLGRSLFRQKKYREAAEVYKNLNEKYWEVRCLYRAGEKEAFDSALTELVRTGDKRAGPILLTVASDKRKDGQTEEALKIYQTVMEKFPSETEEALWGTGWTYFLTGEYKKAADILTKLYDINNDSKYLYWKARSLEVSGEDAAELYHSLTWKERDFYGIMSYVRKKISAEKSGWGEDQKSLYAKILFRTNPVAIKKIDRIEALLEFGLLKETLSELIHASKYTSSMEELIYLFSKFKELGEYKHMVSLAGKMPYKEDLQPFCYPLAYFDTVEELSKKKNLDPFLVLSVMKEESMFDPKARSNAGALGLMQVMPQTAYQLGRTLQLPIDNPQQIFDVKNNLGLGIYYLKLLIEEFGSYSHALAAYNAGEEIVKKWLQKGNYKSVDEFIEDIPYSETKDYVKRVITTFFEYKRVYPAEKDPKEISLGKL
ncbi:MAG: tetratricopeptide repeat protein [Nitrospirota bacterium]